MHQRVKGYQRKTRLVLNSEVEKPHDMLIDEVCSGLEWFRYDRSYYLSGTPAHIVYSPSYQLLQLWPYCYAAPVLGGTWGSVGSLLIGIDIYHITPYSSQQNRSANITSILCSAETPRYYHSVGRVQPYGPCTVSDCLFNAKVIDDARNYRCFTRDRTWFRRHIAQQEIGTALSRVTQ